jgi:thiol-disulfide isomerase/thioredoxin
LQPVSVATEQQDDKTIEHLKLASDNETMDVIIDPKTQLIQSIELKMTGGEFAQPGSTVVYKHTYEYETHDKPLDPSAFTLDPGQRQRVDLLASLMPRVVPPAPGAAAEAPEAHLENALVDKPAPTFTLATIDEKSVALDKLRGRVVVLDFWASWCGPCMQALPMLHQVAKWAADEQLPVTVITINTMEIRDPNAKPEDRLASAKGTWTKKNFTLPVAMDYDDAVKNSYGVNGIPMSVIIRSDGVVHAVHVGYGSGYVQMLKDDIQAALKAVEK